MAEKYKKRDGSGLVIVQDRLCAFTAERSAAMIQVELPDHVVRIEDGVFGDHIGIHITMPVNCPSWYAGGEPARSVIVHPGCSLSFRNESGEIVAKVVLASFFEDMHVEDDFVRSIRCRESGGFDFAAYDSMFSKLGRDENRTRMALVRLQYPYELPAEMEEAYISFIRANGDTAGKQLIDEGNMEMFRILLQKKVFEPETAAELIGYAQKAHRYDFLPDLIDYQKQVLRETDLFGSLELADDGAGE